MEEWFKDRSIASDGFVLWKLLITNHPVRIDLSQSHASIRALYLSIYVEV